MVILDIKDYIDEDNRQFNNTSNYEQLDFDPTELHTDKIKSEIINLKNSLLEEKIETPEFHLLPKIHKANNPGRPVIVLLIITLVEFQNLLIVTYNLM